jgi:hypothetical protein
MAEDPISKITRPPQTRFHLGRRGGASFRRFDSGPDRFARRLLPDSLLQCLHKWIERTQHRPIAGLRATQLTDGPAALIKRFDPLLEFGCSGVRQ